MSLTKKIFLNLLIWACASLVLFLQPVFSGQGAGFDSPENEAAEFQWDGKNIVLEYNGGVIFRAEIGNFNDSNSFIDMTDEGDGKINQVLKWTTRDWNNPLKLVGYITTSEEGFPCEAERKRTGIDIVRHSVGLSKSLLNRGVYDRKYDWVLSLDFPSDVRVIPESTSENGNRFKIEITGHDIILRFRPHFYQKHRGLKYFKPWEYRVWQDPVVGWCSWFAYFKDITEDKMMKAADMISEVLAPYGYEYIQMDDGYQQEPAGVPETWLEPNEKFPSGLEYLSEYILDKGLKPGIWTYTSFHQKEYADSNKELFVPDKDGNPAYGNWVGYILDGTNPEVFSRIIRPLYSGFREMGWKYFKVDALRHLRYEGYNSYSDYFRDKDVDLVETYRNFVKNIRDEIGRENFMLGCWGIRPELTGLIDGCRIGGDGFGYAGLAQYNSFNNVIWRNDPDHIELSREEAYRSCMVTSLTGSLFMLTDKPEVYTTDIIEPAKRTVPVMFTLPNQIYDVDPSRSMDLGQTNSEVSGDEIRVIDSDRNPRCDLYLLEINKPFENWMVLGRTGGDSESIRFRELGLPDENEYLVFEYWSKRLLGTFNREFYTGDIDPLYNCQLFCIRKRVNRPQVIATNRHITCGGFELENVEWSNNSISGTSVIVGNDTYTIYLTEPEGYTFNDFTCDNAEIIGNTKIGIMRVIQIRSDESLTDNWNIEYEKK
ncbi:alpha-galactosidase [candidate division KSB1 bacterium]